jgi:hypothetical protein
MTAGGENDEEDCWAAFGSDDDNDDVDTEEEAQDPGVVFDIKAASAIALHLSQAFLRHNPQVPMSSRKALVIHSSNCSDEYQHRHCQLVAKALEQRDVTVTIAGRWDNVDWVDAIIVLDDSADKVESWMLQVMQNLCHGGTLIVLETLLVMKELQDDFVPVEMHVATSNPICKLFKGNSGGRSDNGSATTSLSFVARTRKSVRTHASTCPWLPLSHSIASEEERLQQATVTLSSHESSSSRMTEASVQKAVHHMNQHGYCIIRSLLNADECQAWGQAVLDSVHEAAKILLERDGVDIYNPQSSRFEPQSYQELSMREDLRLDIRQGPGLTKIRGDRGDGENGNQSIVLTASAHDYLDGIFLRGHPNVLEIVRRTMNPKDARNALYMGNLGRFNFGGRGADGSYQDLRLSPVGGIVSLPGAADQALHADTPHLFEHIPDLPAHYVNIFAPAVPFDDKVGGTAFVHGSHNLAFTAKYCGGENEDNSKVYPFLVRPRLTVGDVVMFDCRILHFGLANTSSSVERCICYTNTWHNWFHDAKNWDMNRQIFGEDD